MLTYEKLLDYMNGIPGSTREFPFGSAALVFKVMGKMFALMSWQSDPIELNLKCDPERALLLRQLYTSVTPGYHMNKTHWNTVVIDATIPDEVICEMIDDSYQLVVAGLTRKDRELLSGQITETIK